MTDAETLTVLAIFAAAWPHMEMPEDTHELWIQAMGDVGAAEGLAAARSIVLSDEWPPSVARFREVAASLVSKDLGVALPLPRMELPEARAAIDDARQHLARGLAERLT